MRQNPSWLLFVGGSSKIVSWSTIICYQNRWWSHIITPWGALKKWGTQWSTDFNLPAKINNPGAAGFQGAHGRSGDSESLGPCGWEAEPNRWWQNRNGLGIWWPPTCDLETNQGWTNPKFRYWRCVIEHWLLFIVVGSANCGELPRC